MTAQEAIKFLRETIAGCHILRDRQLKAVCEISIKALEKQIPKKPVEKFPFDVCPECGGVVIPHRNYCCDCGLKLDWSDGE